MKKIITIILLFITFTCNAATVVKPTVVTVKTSDVKVLWCSSCSKTSNVGLDENSILENYSDWYYGVYKFKQTTMAKMILDGWNINQIVQSGIAGQYYVVFTK